MLMNIASQSNLDAARIGFHAAFLQFLGLSDAFPLEQLFMQVPSTTILEEWEWLSDVPGFEEWTGDRILEVFKAFKLQVRNKDWSSGLKIHQNQLKDDKLGLFPQQIAALAQMARMHRPEYGAKLLINGVAGNVFPETGNGLAYDGKFFFDTTHATGSNKGAAALSAAGIDATELLLNSQTSYDGKRKLRIRGTHIICGPKLEPVARKLVGADFLANAAGTAADSNIYKGRYQIIVEPWLTGTWDDWWFLADLSKPAKPVLFQMREEISTSMIIGNQGGAGDSIPRFQRGELWFGAEARYNMAYFEHRTIACNVVA